MSGPDGVRDVGGVYGALADGRYRAYPEYKDSGVEWLGEVPAHWEVTPIKRLGRIRYGLGEPPEYVDIGLPFIRATDIYRGKIVTSKVKRVDPSDVPLSRNPIVQTGDILVVRSGAYTGDSAMVTDEIAGAIAGYDMVLTIRKAYPKFIAYALLSKYLLDGQIYLAKLRAAQPHLNSEELGNCLAIVPSLNEQRSVVSFLDSQTEKIDNLIAAKRELLALLKEKRQAVITHAVTKGLDPNVKFKPSGVDWLGGVPEHWGIQRLKHLVRIRYGLGEPPGYVEVGLPFIRATDIYRGKINTALVRYVDHKDIPLARKPYLNKGEILVVRSGAYTGDSAIVTKNIAGSVAGYDLVLTPVKIRPEYLAYSLLGKHLLEGQIYLAKLRAAQPHLNAEELGNCFVLVPPIKEQNNISDYLAEETLKIENLSKEIETAIAKLQEYRTALISAAVTGKIDVRGYAP